MVSSRVKRKAICGGGKEVEREGIIWQVKSNYFDMCETLTTGWASNKARLKNVPWRKWTMSDDDNELTGLCDPVLTLHH